MRTNEIDSELEPSSENPDSIQDDELRTDLHDDEESGIVGEYDEENSEDIDLVSAATISTCVTEFPLSPELKEVAEKRISQLLLLEKLEAKRNEFRKDQELDPKVTAELNRQSTELKLLPEKSQLAEKFSIFQKKIEDTKRQQEKLKEQAVIDGATKIEIIVTPELLTAWKLGNEQYKLFFERSRQGKKIFEATKKYLKNEPLYNMLVASGYPAEKLFCYAIYCLALENWSQALKQTRKDSIQHNKDLQNRKSGIFRKVSKDVLSEIEKAENLSNNCSSTISAINKEIKNLEKTMVDEFWKCYEFCACLLVSKKVDKKREPVIRVFLRYSLIGHSPWFISPDISKSLLKDCIEDTIDTLEFSQRTDKIFYADEYLEHIAANNITASINEELELTGKNSPEWHADKATRRLAYSKERAVLLKEIRAELIQKIRKLRKQQQEEEIRISKILKSAPDYKKQKAILAQSIQKCKVESARYERIINKIADEEIPSIKDKVMAAKQKISSSNVKRNTYDIARREARAIHRVCRLCARLKDPFLPFVLRESYSTRSDILNNRSEMTNILNHIEYADKHIFQEVLVNAKRETSRIYMRVSPVILITPSCGFIGYSWNPRSGVESGKLVVPGYCPRINIKERMIYNMVADFRWDTSKAEAGIDLLTSDTLVAAYSACRWNYRKRKKENREKALIFNEINDRSNWRRHYELFLMSAKDSGRKLFYKNYEVYDMIIRYIGLPEGMERLKR